MPETREEGGSVRLPRRWQGPSGVPLGTHSRGVSPSESSQRSFRPAPDALGGPATSPMRSCLTSWDRSKRSESSRPGPGPSPSAALLPSPPIVSSDIEARFPAKFPFVPRLNPSRRLCGNSGCGARPPPPALSRGPSKRGSRVCFRKRLLSPPCGDASTRLSRGRTHAAPAREALTRSPCHTEGAWAERAVNNSAEQR